MKTQLEGCCKIKGKDSGPPSVILNKEPDGTTARRVAPTA